METTEEITRIITSYFQICNCQRKIKTIVFSLLEIKEKCINRDFNFTGSEWLLIAIIESRSKSIIHGINCEYPIINEDDQFWSWIDSIKNNPNLIDN